MLKRLLVVIFILLHALLLQAQQKESASAPGTPAVHISAVNRADLIAYAKLFLGTRYHSGSYNPQKGFDCSGFVYHVFKKFKVPLPRSSGEYQALGKALKPEDFKVGDVLVFYGYKDSSIIGHVGIICEADGMKSRFIHSSSGKAYGVTISDLDSKMYHRRFYKW
jgi:cell wall-associated NlpC family hydrolase